MERRLLERTTPKGNYTEKRLDGKGNPRKEEIGHTQRGGTHGDWTHKERK